MNWLEYRAKTRQQYIYNYADFAAHYTKRDSLENWEALVRERDNLILLVSELHQQEEWELLAEVAQELAAGSTAFQERGYWKEWIDIVDRGYKAAEKTNDKVAQSILLGSRAMYYLYAGNPEKAHLSFQRALELADDTQDAKAQAVIYHQWGVSLHNKGESADALLWLKKSLLLREKQHKTDTLHQIGMIYADWGQYSTALEYFRKSLSLIDEKENPIAAAGVFHEMGLVHYEMGELETAQSLFYKNLNLSKQIGAPTTMSSSLNVLGHIAYDYGDLETAETYYRQSLKIDQNLGYLEGVSKSLHDLAKIAQDKGFF